MKIFFPFDLSDKIDHKILRKSEDLLSKTINEENTYDIRELNIVETEMYAGLS